MAFRKIINNFTRGELDPRFLAMVDYDGYHKGCRKYRNVVGIPQGGSIRRFGTNFSKLVEKDRDGTPTPVTDISKVRIFPFEYNGDEKFSIVIRPDPKTTGGNPHTIAFDVYQSQSLVDTFFPPVDTYSESQIREFRWTLGEDRVILFHNDTMFHELVRNDFNDWECNTITLVHYPTYDYTNDDDLANKYTDSGETFTATATSGTITFSRSAGSSTPFHDNHVGGLIYTETSGVIRITSITSSTSVDGYTLIDLGKTSNRGSEILILEKAWSDDSNVTVQATGRGWPGNGDFFQGRLVAGNWKSKPGRGSSTIVNGYYDFNDSDDDASTGYSFFTGSSGNDVIHDVVGYKSLVTIGFKGPSASSILLTEPTTPTNIFVDLQDTKRATRIDAKVINNQILYASYNKESILSMAYELPDTGYEVSNISALSSHLITEARWADVFSPSDQEGNFYLLVNEDGTIAALQLLQEENIRAWSQCYTNGDFIDISCAGDEGHVLVRRKITTDTTVGGGPNYVYRVESNFEQFVDTTEDIAAGTATAYLRNEDDYIVIASEIEFNRIDIQFDTVASADCDLTFEYLDSFGEWTEFTPTDNTSGFTVNGEINWTDSDVSNWAQDEVNDIPRQYWIRIRRTETTVATTPILDQLYVNTAVRIYREELDFDSWMDCQIDKVADSNGDVTGLGPLAGQNAFVYADDFPLGTYKVTASGTLALGSANANANVSVGLDYKPLVVPMPVDSLLQNGYNTYHKQHITEAYIDYYKSLGITCNGQNVIQDDAGLYLAVKKPVPKTNFWVVPVHRGWNPRQEIEISQSYPAPMTLLGIGLTVEGQ